VEKWILRQAFADLLPPEITWRTKSQFDEGSGTVERLVELAGRALEGVDWSGWDEAEPARLRSVEEAWYFDAVRGHYPDDWEPIRDTTALWSEGRVPTEGR
jgi:asparagine synthase (glutamine-hydrolysing)